MKKVALIFLIGILTIGCSKEKLTFTDKTFKKNIVTETKEDTTSVEITIPVATNKTTAADSINTLLFKTIKNILSFDEEPSKAKEYSDLTAEFIANYKKTKEEAPDFSAPWEAMADAKVIYESENLMNIQIDYYSFTGGAHGYGATLSLFVDPKTGKKMDPKSLFSNITKFTDLAEQKLRKDKKIPTDKPINETGYWFTDDKFHLPNNIFYTKKGVLLLYNQYEVASYADGPIEILIPYSEADTYLKIK